MGRFRQLTADDSSETGIDISPLIDCVFILLIFFIVTTTFVEIQAVFAFQQSFLPMMVLIPGVMLNYLRCDQETCTFLY